VVSHLEDERISRACTRNARRVAAVHRNYVEYADVLAEMHVWVLANSEWVQQYLDTGSRGMTKLNTALWRCGHAYAANERMRRTGCKPGDHYWYSTAVVEDLLPAVWSFTDWLATGSPSDAGMPKGRSRPSEGNNRVAMLVDVAGAVRKLPADDIELLRQRYVESMDWVLLGRLRDQSQDAVRKRVDRLLLRLVDFLGGEPPVWNTGRRAKSNAAMQFENRKQTG